jgi:hypothetical protein
VRFAMASRCSEKGDRLRSALTKFAGVTVVWLCAATCSPTLAQQFNSDNYLSKPHGMATIILTAGEQSRMMMTTLSLFPKWEFTAAAYLYNKDQNRKTGEGYSTSLYAKWMLYENKAKTGGVAVKFGAGQKPSYVLDGSGFESASNTYWMNVPLTLPFCHNKLSWDLMPGASVTRDFGDNSETVGAFTYSTRLAWYPMSSKLALVGEAYGAEGEAELNPEYKAGLRWEPNDHANFALTYGGKFDGSHGSGFEIGVMLFTPPFACFGRCRS